jgi:hypothetical protein
MQVEAVRVAVTALRAAHDELAAGGIDTLTRDELFAVADDLEFLDCQLPTQRHRILTQLQTQTTPRELGAKSWREVLMIRWRLSSAEAHRRLADAAVLGPRQALSGQPLAPVLAATAAAQALGLITKEHVEVMSKGMAKLPRQLDPATRDQIEVEWIRDAIGTGPKELADTVARKLFLLDQDGPAPDDAERAKRRGISKGPQLPDGNIHLAAELTPEAWAIWEALFAKYAAPGMCNPADEQPATSGTPTQDQIDSDTRTLAQRRHDAFAFIGRTALDKTELGQHNGLPTTIIVRTTLQDLESRAGVGVSGGGTVLPLTDVLRLAAHADSHHYLAVFDGATGSALNLFRARRTASVAQRIMLIARDGGCTKPGCTVPAYGTQAHHAARDWTAGGLTNVDDLALACGPDNRMVGPEGWTTRLNDHHDVEWIPPPHLDTGQTRINRYHRPEELHPPSGDAWTPRRADDAGPLVNEPLTFGDAFGSDESVVASDDAGTPRRADDDEPVVNVPLTFGEAFAPDESATNGDNTTHQASDPDPPDGKAA